MTESLLPLPALPLLWPWASYLTALRLFVNLSIKAPLSMTHGPEVRPACLMGNPHEGACEHAGGVFPVCIISIVSGGTTSLS